MTDCLLCGLVEDMRAKPHPLAERQSMAFLFELGKASEEPELCEICVSLCRHWRRVVWRELAHPGS